MSDEPSTAQNLRRKERRRLSRSRWKSGGTSKLDVQRELLLQELEVREGALLPVPYPPVPAVLLEALLFPLEICPEAEFLLGYLKTFEEEEGVPEAVLVEA